MPTIPAKPSFRERLPRLYELKDMVEDAAHPDAYFQNFEDGFAEHEEQARRVPEARAAACSSRRSGLGRPEGTRCRGASEAGAWSRLAAALHVFSEARAYGYLVSIGCTGVRFIPRGKRKTPDLAATLAGEPVFCEVKTINISGEEADKRRRVGEAR